MNHRNSFHLFGLILLLFISASCSLSNKLPSLKTGTPLKSKIENQASDNQGSPKPIANEDEGEEIPIAPCGSHGTLVERIADCQNRNGALAKRDISVDSGGEVQTFSWTMVEFNQELDGSWRDEDTGLVWGIKLSDLYTFDGAVAACKLGPLTVNRLPSSDDFLTASAHGFFDLFPGEFPYWTSSIVDLPHQRKATIYSKASGTQLVVPSPLTTYAVRCVGN